MVTWNSAADDDRLRARSESGRSWTAALVHSALMSAARSRYSAGRSRRPSRGNEYLIGRALLLCCACLCVQIHGAGACVRAASSRSKWRIFSAREKSMENADFQTVDSPTATSWGGRWKREWRVGGNTCGICARICRTGSARQAGVERICEALGVSASAFYRWIELGVEAMIGVRFWFGVSLTIWKLSSVGRRCSLKSDFMELLLIWMFVT